MARRIRSAGELGGGWERGRKGVDEIEMELPEGTDGPAGFRTRRKIKTRPNGCEGKFYYATSPSLAFPNYASAVIPEGYRFQNI